jgi:hypothetical protein
VLVCKRAALAARDHVPIRQEGERIFRAAKEQRRAVRVADRYQDTMRFTVAGPDRFLGSGHPDFQKDPDLPPLLGLIKSEDAGQTWEPVSMLGEADFHSTLWSDLRIQYGQVGMRRT